MNYKIGGSYQKCIFDDPVYDRNDGILKHIQEHKHHVKILPKTILLWMTIEHNFSSRLIRMMAKFFSVLKKNWFYCSTAIEPMDHSQKTEP